MSLHSSESVERCGRQPCCQQYFRILIFFVCFICCFFFSEESRYRKHRSLEHSHTCQLVTCRKSFVLECDLVEHMKKGHIVGNTSPLSLTHMGRH